MYKGKRIGCVIPARLASTRFPRKVLAPLLGKPLLRWVWEAARQVSLFDWVVIAVDAQETADVVRHFGAEAVMTPEECTCGTDRLAFLQQTNLFEADVWVNWQADEPLLTKEIIEELLSTCDQEKISVWTLKKKVNDPQVFRSPHVVKVLCNQEGRALNFSRTPFPGCTDKHCGLYAFSAGALRTISTLPPSERAVKERLEQLTFLENNLWIHVQETQGEIMGVDLPEHLAEVERQLDLIVNRSKATATSSRPL